MTQTNMRRLRGVLSPVVTPFRTDYAPDAKRFVRHCKWLLAHGCSGLAVFGTNSEANSLSADERMTLLEQLVEGGVPAAALMPGTGCSALTDSVRLTAHAVKLGCAGALMLPPFYYKGVPDEGLFRNFSEVIQRVGDDRLQVYLYHIPPVSQVPITLGLIERLLKAYPKATAGVKDSSGDWNNTKAMIDAFGKQGFDVFAGSEVFLLRTMKRGRGRLHHRRRERQPARHRQGLPRVAVGGGRDAASHRRQGARHPAGPGVDDPGAQGDDRPLRRRRRLADRAAAARRADARRTREAGK